MFRPQTSQPSLLRAALRRPLATTTSRPYYHTLQTPVQNSRLFSTTSTESESTREWLIVFPDKPGVLDHRIAIRPRHSPNFVRLHQEGYVSWAGPIFTHHPSPSQPTRRPFTGSIMVVNATNKIHILEKLRSDPYIAEGVWDLDRAEIFPFRTVLRKGLR